MTIGVVGRKHGMTRLFTEEGESVPVTVIEVEPNRVTQVKTEERDGYRALQVTTGTRRASRISKPMAGHYAASGVAAGRGLWEFRLGEGEGVDIAVGSEIKADQFKVGERVDVSGITRGKGFAGVIKRHHFSGQDRSHGNSLSHRAPGSIGQNQSPGRVFPGKRMAGHLGDVPRSAVNLEVMRVDPERNLILVRGAVPGAPGGDVVIRPTLKK